MSEQPRIFPTNPRERDLRTGGQTLTAEPPPADFRSVLWLGAAADPGAPEAPDYFGDLYLDQVERSLLANREAYNLTPFFRRPPQDTETIAYRHEIFVDLEQDSIGSFLTSFADGMATMRDHQPRMDADALYDNEQKCWFIEAVSIYCQTVQRLAQDLDEAAPESRGLLGLRRYLAGYVASTEFVQLVADTERVREALAGVRYCLHIKGDKVRVTKYRGEDDYSVEVERIFERFKRGAVKDYRVGYRRTLGFDHVEAAILNLVARLFDEVFAQLDGYYVRHRDYLDPTIARFDREIQFYLAYLAYVRRFQAAGLSFCYPEVLSDDKAISATDTFDVALADKLLSQRSEVVCNDFELHDGERIFVVSGPNQGGKTTFARTFGQLHHLANLGCPVPGASARLLLFDQLFTQFEREENLAEMGGKLEDDLIRIKGILTRATARSIIIMNETFSSTTLHDATFLGRRVLEKVIELDALAVYVTFVDELASLGDATVSMVSNIVPEDPTRRTYKVLRRPADGLAYAIALAEKYGLTHERLKGRLAP